jgi:hypothetical protein
MAKTTFVDGNAALGIPGTIVLAAFLNALNNHRHTGRDIDGEGALDYAVTTGSANAYLLSLAPALDAYIPGVPFFFKANFTNSGAATMAINALSAVALKKNLNDDLVAGDIVSGRLYMGMYDGTNIVVINVAPSNISKSGYPHNYGLSASVASNALTVARKGEDGNDPSSTNIVEVPFRNPTLTVGTPTRISYTAAGSIVLPQGSTLGFLASEAGRFYVYEGTDGTDKDIGVARTSFVPEDRLYSSTAISAAATAADVLYSNTTRTNWVWRCVGYVEATMSATLGNWASIEKVQVMGPGIKRTGETVQDPVLVTATDDSTGTVLPSDNTIPQITEGKEFMSVSLTPSSACNLIEAQALVKCSISDYPPMPVVALFNGATNAIDANTWYPQPGGGAYTPPALHLYDRRKSGTTSQMTFSVRGGPGVTGYTFYFNKIQAGQNIFGGVNQSHLKIREIQA